MTDFLESFTRLEGARYVLECGPRVEGGYFTRVSLVDLRTGEVMVDGAGDAVCLLIDLAYSEATTKGQALVGALTSALGDALAEVHPYYCAYCSRRAAGRDAEHGTLACWECLKKPFADRVDAAPQPKRSD